MEEHLKKEESKISYGDIKSYFLNLLTEFVDLSHGVDKWGQ